MQLVLTINEKVTTTSRLVAQKFGKEHKDVLRAISNLECSDEFRERNFALSSYTSSQGRKLPEYIITRDGFSFLVMAFTGRDAAKFKEEFIEEFNRMEEVLRKATTPILIPTYQQRVLSEPTKQCPKGHWSIFDESHSVMLAIEKHIGSVNQYDLVDGSIGKRWAKFREGKDWAELCSSYPHEYKDVRGTRDCKCYKYSELEHFREWLKNVYKQQHLPQYLRDKYTREKNIVMLDRVNQHLPKLLGRAA